MKKKSKEKNDPKSPQKKLIIGLDNGGHFSVSDKPIHRKIKLRSMANNFYNDRVNQHLKIGLRAIQLIYERGIDSLHSRKLRGFDEPAFR